MKPRRSSGKGVPSVPPGDSRGLPLKAPHRGIDSPSPTPCPVSQTRHSPRPASPPRAEPTNLSCEVEPRRPVPAGVCSASAGGLLLRLDVLSTSFLRFSSLQSTFISRSSPPRLCVCPVTRPRVAGLLQGRWWVAVRVYVCLCKLGLCIYWDVCRLWVLGVRWCVVGCVCWFCACSV